MRGDMEFLIAVICALPLLVVACGLFALICLIDEAIGFFSGRDDG